MSSIFDRLEPGDGFRVISHDAGEWEISLHVALYVEGDLAEAYSGDPEEATRKVWSRRQPSTADYADRARLRQVAEAVCRYFNAGGSWDELEALLSEMRPLVSGGISIDGWHYFNGYVDTEGNYTHVWVDKRGNVVRWVENVYIDTALTLEDLAKEMGEDDDAGEIYSDSVSSSACGSAAAPENGFRIITALSGSEAEGE